MVNTILPVTWAKHLGIISSNLLLYTPPPYLIYQQILFALPSKYKQNLPVSHICPYLIPRASLLSILLASILASNSVRQKLDWLKPKSVHATLVLCSKSTKSSAFHSSSASGTSTLGSHILLPNLSSTCLLPLLESQSVHAQSCWTLWPHRP